jgi:hypothetical protein
MSRTSLSHVDTNRGDAEAAMICTGCSKRTVGQTSTWILQEPNDLRGWRAHLCEECDAQRDMRPVQNRVVLTLRRLVKESALTRTVERV